MLKMIQAKLGPERAQAKFPKTLFFLGFFEHFAYFLTLAALHWASLLRAPLAKIGQKPFVLYCFGQFGRAPLEPSGGDQSKC